MWVGSQIEVGNNCDHEHSENNAPNNSVLEERKHTYSFPCDHCLQLIIHGCHVLYDTMKKFISISFFFTSISTVQHVSIFFSRYVKEIKSWLNLCSGYS
jgi:hypothetical protein